MDFKSMLVLSYFFQYKSRYLLSELQELLGFTSMQLESKIFKLMEDDYLKYEENLLSITRKGLQIVLSRNLDSFPFQIVDDAEVATVSIGKAIELKQIYIPKNFNTKYKCKGK